MVCLKVHAYGYIIYLNSLIRIDEINGKSWQFSIVIHDEGDGLTFCAWFSQCEYDYIDYYVNFKSMWSFLFTISFICKLLEIYVATRIFNQHKMVDHHHVICEGWSLDVKNEDQFLYQQTTQMSWNHKGVHFI